MRIVERAQMGTAGARWVAGAIMQASELLEYESKETERLETRIAKQTRHCAELKAMEEIRSKT